MGVSALLIAKNEADRIGPCLASIAWVDEIIVVVDATSSDATEAMCRAAGARVITEPWQGFAHQRAVGLAQVTQEWILSLDADEHLTPELCDSMRQALADPGNCVAYEATTWNVFWGRPLVCRYPNFRLRLLRRDAGQFQDVSIHEYWAPDDPNARIGRLRGDVMHDCFRSFQQMVEKWCRYADLGAQEIYKRGPVTSLWPAWHHALFTFFKYQVLKGGYRDGAAGFAYNLAHAFYTFHKYVRAYELTCQARAATDRDETTATVPGAR